MTGRGSHTGLDPASMRFYRTRMDSRVKHGNDRGGEVMPDVIRHPWGFTGEEWIPVSGTGMTGGGSHAGRDPASMRFYRRRVDFRVRSVK
ncbi:MAG: hypothetical protein ISR54_07355 [Chlorobium phaeobacteroides]|nr:hypothetical protein [Chlorobium phaeobacteroides]